MRIRTLLKLSAISAVFLPGPLFAQAATDATTTAGQQPGPAPVATAPAAPADGNDIIVTAQRREQRLQDVPISVSAFSGATVQKLQMENAFDIAKFVPSTHITQSAFKGTATYFIRGIGSLDITSTNDPPITTYENDLIIPRPNANNIGLYDVDRIEVLRGPQGTLFGRNTSGGAINIILKKPQDALGGYFEGGYGSFDKWQLRGSVDAPINDKILTKTSGFYVNDPGYIKDITTHQTVGGEKNYGVREDIRLLPTETFTWDLSGEYERNQGVGFQLRSIGTAPAITDPAPPVYYQTQTGSRVGNCGPNPLGTWIANGSGNCSVTRTLGLGSVMTYDAAAGTLQLLYGYRQYWARYAFDASDGVGYRGGTNLFSDGYGFSHSAELKWSSSAFDDRVKYVAGVYFLNVVDQNRLSTATGTLGGTYSVSQDIRIRTDVDSLAGYLQGDIKIVDGVTLTLGGRITHDVKHLDYLPENEYGAPTITTADVIAVGQPVRQVDNRFTPRVALQYKITPNVSVYASATNGFKGSSWNARVNSPSLVVAVKPEVVWAYEAGLRSQFFDHRLTVNLTAFQQNLHNYQNTVQVVLNDVLTTLLENIANVRTRGVEFDMNYDITKRISLSANGSFLRSKYTKADPFPGVPANKQLSVDEPPTQAPKFQINAGPTYRLPLGNEKSVSVSALWRHTSPYQISILNPVLSKTDDFVDALLQYDAGKWYASVGCTNCTNRNSYMLILTGVYPVDPRRVTGKIGYRF